MQITLSSESRQKEQRLSLRMEMKEYLNHMICGSGTFRTERHLAYCIMPRMVIDTVMRSQKQT